MLKHRAKAFYIIVIAAAIAYFVWTSNARGTPDRFRLGLDLSGGSHLVYQADVSKLAPEDIADSMTALRDSVERRVNLFGVSEPLVQTEQGGTLASKESAYKLIVELPGVTDTKQAVNAIGATPSLEFLLASSTQIDAFRTSAAATATTSPLESNPDFMALFKQTGLTGSAITRASLQFDPNTNQPQVALTFGPEGQKLFSDITRNHTHDYLGIFLDGVLIEYPTINQEIPNGQAVISGGFTTESASALVRNLNYGALPIPVTLISEQTIGPTLGQEAVRGGIKAGVVAFIIIALFLIIWYRLPGLVATLALAIYTVLMLALFKIIPVTLTAAGIAGFIITIGMAVDANILIFERMKEELARGRGAWDAMHEGFARAWPSIRDSNVSSIITGIILYKFGSTSVVTGFALVFVVGVLVSMFTAITVSRLFLYAISPRNSTRLSRFLINNGFRKAPADNN
ncbi:MAG: protein-export rane protein SecD, preprotein translocase subunit SecD [Candidatus Parcubacteria bacterium]|nr:protein-export rane protein SecD, preprotein translocase subunit SecD [Candidatus Parcubacteria bacterium]